MTLLKSYIKANKKYLFLVFFFLTAFILIINFCNDYIAQKQISSLIEKYGNLQSVPSSEIETIDFESPTLDCLFLGCIISGTAIALNQLYIISLQNSVSRKSLRKSYIVFSLILCTAISFSMLVITLVSDSFLEYYEIQSWFKVLNSRITDSKPIVYLLYFVQWFAEGILFSAVSGLIIMSSKKYRFRRLFAVLLAAALILSVAAVSSAAYGTYALHIALAVFALLIFIGFWRLFKTMSLEYKL